MKIVEILIDGGSLLKKVENAEAEKLVKANAAKYASKARWKAEVRDRNKPARPPPPAKAAAVEAKP